MTDQIKNYIDEGFINLNIKKIPFSFFVIRTSLLNAVQEFKPMLHGIVLDIACGVMPYKEFLGNPSIKKYIGIDLKPTQYHNQVKPDLYWDGKNIPVENCSCDFVIATEFFEHYLDTNHILLEINRVLKDGGTLFFTVPFLWPLHEAPNDYYRFTPFSLIEHFKKAKFSSWEIKPLGGYHSCLALMISLWNDNKLSLRGRRMIRPFIEMLIRRLLRKDKAGKFENGSCYSGIYGFVKK